MNRHASALHTEEVRECVDGDLDLVVLRRISACRCALSLQDTDDFKSMPSYSDMFAQRGLLWEKLLGDAATEHDHAASLSFVERAVKATFLDVDLVHPHVVCVRRFNSVTSNPV